MNSEEIRQVNERVDGYILSRFDLLQVCPIGPPPLFTIF